MDDLISRQKAKDAIDMALDHIDHVPTWVYDNLLNALNEVPSVKPTHPTPSKTLGALDCVDRKAVVDLVESFYKIDKSVLNIMVFKLKQLPYAQPEIIRCKYCKHWFNASDNDEYNSCEEDALIRHKDFFCANGKLRGDSDD